MRRWILAFALASGVTAACGPGYPYCERDASCRSREYCVLRRCQQCRTANDCSPAQRCVQGRCE